MATAIKTGKRQWDARKSEISVAAARIQALVEKYNPEHKSLVKGLFDLRQKNSHKHPER